MAIDEKLTTSVRTALAGVPAVSEVKMFGGIGFMLNGNMMVGASDRGLLVRVGADAGAKARERPGATPMVMWGREMPGYLRVEGVPLDARTVKPWVRLARAFVETLPPKQRSTKSSKPTPKKRAAKAIAKVGAKSSRKRT